jgi:beta-galactosidase GanA
VAEFCRLAQREGLKVLIRPGPYVCGEWDFGGLYTGWFDRWGHGSVRGGGVEAVVKTLEWMVAHRASFNLYMAHGGSSFGFRAGANAQPYMPQPTSYDYDAPISEAGWDTPKYHAIRRLLGEHLAEGQPVDLLFYRKERPSRSVSRDKREPQPLAHHPNGFQYQRPSYRTI